MGGFLVVLAAVVIIALWFIAIFYLALADYWPFAVVVAVVGVAVIVYDGSKKGPCAQYENRAQYDPALKIVRTMRVCIERGEWVDG